MGFCEACHYDRLVADAVTRERARADARRRAWEERATEARRRWWTERQDRHRLAERVRPATPAPAWADPWVLAEEALEGVAALRAHLNPGSTLRQIADAIAEHIRWLATGPTAEASGPRGDHTGPPDNNRERPRRPDNGPGQKAFPG
jgi:hypothetical protein